MYCVFALSAYEASAEPNDWRRSPACFKRVSHEQRMRGTRRLAQRRKGLNREMTDATEPLRSDTRPQANRHGLQLFADGCHEPRSAEGGWAFVVYRDAEEISADCGGIRNATNNAMEVMALLQALRWVNGHAAGQVAIIWSDSHHAVNGCNSWLPIWRHNGWKKIDPNPRARRRTIADPDLWKAVDLQLSQNPLVTIAWCKGHVGIDGNERADALANEGRLSIRTAARPG